MKLIAGIARHRTQAPDPLGFDALRLHAVTAAQLASGELWTDYNLHDPGVSLLEALCFALTEDLFAARQPVPQLFGLGAQAGPAAWARFGLHTPQALLPCHPCTDDDWQSWLLQQLPHARHLHMLALRDERGRSTGLWRMTLQGHSDAADDKHELRRKAAPPRFRPDVNDVEEAEPLPLPLRDREAVLACEQDDLVADRVLEPSKILGKVVLAPRLIGNLRIEGLPQFADERQVVGGRGTDQGIRYWARR